MVIFIDVYDMQVLASFTFCCSCVSHGLLGDGKRCLPGEIAVLLGHCWFVDQCVWVGLSIWCLGLCGGLKFC